MKLFRDWFDFKSAFYKRSLAIALLITCIPTLLIGLSAYFVGIGQFEKQIRQEHHTQVKLSTERISDQISNLQLSVTQALFNLPFLEKLRGIHLIDHVNEVHQLYRSLLIINHTNPLISSSYIYLDEQGVLISDEDGIVKLDNSTERAYYQNLLNHKTDIFWQDSLPQPQQETTGSTPISMIRLLTVGMDDPYGALIVDLDEEKINNILNELAPAEDGTSFIMSMNGEWLGPDKKSDNQLAVELQAELANRQQPGDSFLWEYDDNFYSVSRAEIKLSNLSWMYVSATPLSRLNERLVFISHILLFIGAFGFLFSVALALIASRKLYHPIKHLMRIFNRDVSVNVAETSRPSDELAFIEGQWQHLTRESRHLQTLLEQSQQSLRDGFLLQLVQGHFYAQSKEQLVQRMEQFGFEANNKGFAIMIVQLVGLSRLAGRFAEGDEQLITFAAANIVRELVVSQPQQTEIINFQDLTIGMLLFYDSRMAREQVKSHLFQLAQDTISNLSALLKMDVTVSIGKVTADITRIPEAITEARDALWYRSLQESQQILDMEDLIPAAEPVFNYPFNLEKKIIHTMRLGLCDETLRLIKSFLLHLVKESGKEWQIQQGVLQLLGSIQHFILQSGFVPFKLFNGVDLFVQLSQIHEPEEMFEWFRQKVIVPYTEEFNKTQDLNMKQMVERVIQTLHERYMTDISLEQCADEHGKNPYTLSRVFKQITGQNFIDYLTELRLEKSKELLLATDLKMNDIADRVGYQISYLFRVFKKYEGMTPGQYREKMQVGSK